MPEIASFLGLLTIIAILLATTGVVVWARPDLQSPPIPSRLATSFALGATTIIVVLSVVTGFRESQRDVEPSFDVMGDGPLGAEEPSSSEMEPLVPPGDQDDATLDAEDAMDEAGRAIEEAAGGATARSTLSAIPSDGLTAMDPRVAVTTIGEWINELGYYDFDGAQAIAQDLKTLKDQLTAPVLDGNAIGRTLSSLGTRTTAVAGDDLDLQRLGSALSSSGALLTTGSPN